MPVTTLNFDGAAEVDIIIVSNHSFVIELTQKDKTTGAAVNYTGIYKMAISTDSQGRDIKMTMTLPTVLNVMTIDKTVIQNTLSSGNYYYDIRQDSGGYSIHFMKGKLIVNPNIVDA